MKNTKRYTFYAIVLLLSFVGATKDAEAADRYSDQASCSKACSPSEICVTDTSGWNTTAPYSCEPRDCNNGGVFCKSGQECKDMSIDPFGFTHNYRCELTQQSTKEIITAMEQAQQIAAQQASQPVTCTTPGCNLSYTPLEPLSREVPAGAYSDLGAYLNYLFPILVTVGALIGVGTFSVFGVVYMTSPVAGDKKKAAGRMLHSIYGLLILLASVLILQTINPQLVNFDLTGLGSGGSSIYSR